MMARRLAILALVMGMLVCTGCLPVVGGIVAAVMDAVGSDSTPNKAPLVLIDPIARTTGPVTIPVRVFDIEGNTVSLAVRYRIGAGAFSAATMTGATSVAADTNGVNFSLQWDAPADLPDTTYRADVEIEITPSDGDKTGAAVLSGTFAFGNNPPAVSVQTITGLQGDAVSVTYTVADASADAVDLLVEYERADDPGNWQPANVLLAPATTTGIATTEAGVQYPLTWQSGANLGGLPAFRGTATIRITATDGFGASSTPAMSNAFDIRHNTTPTVTFASDPLPAGPYAGGVYGQRISVENIFVDAELDFTRIDMQYTTDDGANWQPATLFGNFSALTTDYPTGISHNIAWDSALDLPGTVATVRLRARGVDTDAGNWVELQNAFALDNLNTNAAPTLALDGAGATAIDADTWEVKVTGNTNLASIVNVTGSDIEAGDVITLTLAFNAAKSVNYTAIPAELGFNPAAVSGESVAIATQPSVATINILPNGNLTTLGTIAFDIDLRDDAGNITAAELLIRVVDGVPPVFVGVVGAVPSSPFTVDVGYLDAVDDYSTAEEIRYNIYVSTATPVPLDTPAFTTEPGQNSFTVGGLSPGTMVHFVVRAVDGAGNEDTNKSTKSAITPSAPSYAWQATGILGTVGDQSAGVLLTDGRVLVCGGFDGANDLSRAEIFDPATGQWTAANPMGMPRRNHTATVLPDGRVLVVGGDSGASVTASCEFFDPGTGNWTATTPMPVARQYHSATLTANGDVIVIGGDPTVDQTNALADAYAFDPGSETWTPLASMNAADKRGRHTAVRVGNTIFAIAGWDGAQAHASILAYDIAGDSWSSLETLATARVSHSATTMADGCLLIAGGYDGASTFFASAEIFDPATGTASMAASMAQTRGLHSAICLPSGQILVAGGLDSLTTSRNQSEIYDPSTDTWASAGSMATPRAAFPLVMMPSGDLLAAGGRNGIFVTAASEIFDPTRGAGTWVPTADLRTARALHSALLMPNGKVLISGGYVNGLAATAATEIFDPETFIYTYASTPQNARVTHTFVVLPDGRIMTAGGYVVVLGFPFALASTEIYDPATDTWTTMAAMATARAASSSAVLPDGQVVVAGGFTDSSTTVTDVEIYNPTSDVWTAGPPLPSQRGLMTSVVLPDGRVVMMYGNVNYDDTQTNGFIFDPAGPSFSTTANAGFGRDRAFIPTLWMPDGRIMAIGSTTFLAGATVDFYDPAANTFTAGPLLPGRRETMPAVLLFSGKVLVPGGSNSSTVLGTTHVYNPAIIAWNNENTFAPARASHTALLLPNGRVLMSGGQTQQASISPTATSFLYDEGRGFADSWRPRITAIDATTAFPQDLAAGATVTITGERLRGLDETGTPTVTLIGPISGQSGYVESAHGVRRTLAVTAWADGTSLQTTLPNAGTFTPGYYMLVVTANGVPSKAVIVRVQ